MKRFAVLAASALILPLIGCPATTPNTNQPPAAIAPGYNNSTDQQIGEALASARAFYLNIQCSTQGQGVTAGACDPTKTVPVYTPSAPEKTALNFFATTLNTAEAAYLAYHASPSVVSENIALKDSQQVQVQQNALQPTITGGK